MFCDGVADLDAAERARYADLLVLIAAADGELVREEIQLLEGFMGRAMVHPEARTSIRQGLFDTNRLTNLLKNAEVETLRYVLRDGVLLAAADGEYDRRELRILKKIATAADVDEDDLKATDFSCWNALQFRDHNGQGITPAAFAELLNDCRFTCCLTDGSEVELLPLEPEPWPCSPCL